MYFTDEVAVSQQDKIKRVNEFLVLENIGRGSYSKVKRVIRQDTNPNGTIAANGESEQQQEEQKDE